MAVEARTHDHDRERLQRKSLIREMACRFVSLNGVLLSEEGWEEPSDSLEPPRGGGAGEPTHGRRQVCGRPAARTPNCGKPSAG